MSAYKPVFATEEGLVEALLAQLEGDMSPWVFRCTLREFDYVSGRTDLLSLDQDGAVVAFEAKLANWRKALHQAWRNTSFVNRAYVVLPRDRAEVALRHGEEFKKHGVGLCLVDPHRIEVVIESKVAEPLVPWLHNKAKRTLTDDGCGPNHGPRAISM